MKRLLTVLLCGCLVAVATTASAKKPSSKEVLELTKKVADWQIETFNDQGKYRALPPKEECKPWHHRRKYHDLEWIPATFYAGLCEYAEISKDSKYNQWLYDLSNKYEWKLYKRKYHADDHCVGQAYLYLYENFKKEEKMIAPTKAQFDEIMTSEQGKKIQWFWCDALFMAPPVWARLAKITGDEKYLNYLDKQYHMTYNKLWSKKDQLFFRDASYIKKTEDNGQSIYWARGNGWVFGGLAIMIPDLPKNWEGREFYITLFKEMAATLKKIQRKDGTWSAGLLGGEKAYPNKETSGSAFYTFGIAWGINNGILDKKEYMPTLLKAWEGLSSTVTAEGMVGYAQPVGAAPDLSYQDFTELYANGAFIAAGVEMSKLLK